MHWIVPLWSAIIAVSLTLAGINVLVWIFDRKRRSNLLFAIVAIAAASVAPMELGMMYAKTPAVYAELMRWNNVPAFFMITGTVLFVRSYFGTGRPWLAWTIIAMRGVVLAGSFLFTPNFHFRELISLQQISFLGEEVAVVGRAVVRPGQWLAVGSLLLYLVFAADASLALWRKGGSEDRRRVLVVGGGMISFVLISILLNQLVVFGVLRLPILISPTFLFLLGAMGFELGRDILRANRMAEELRDVSETMNLAAGTAQLALWRWDIPRDSVWVSPLGRRFFGLNETESFSFQRLLDTLHPEDREPTRRKVEAALQGDGTFHAEYRILLPDGSTHWVEARGKVEFNSKRRPLRLLGVSADVTQQRQLQHRFRLAVEASPHGVVLADTQGRILLANEHVAAMFGYDRAELPGLPVEALVPERLRAAYGVHRAGFETTPTARAMGTGHELYALRKDGSEFPVEIGLNPVESAEGMLVLVVIVDISARRQAESETRRLRDELAHIARVTTLSELSGSLAHELNQPLAIILSNAQAAQRLLARNPPDLPEVRDIINDIINADRRAGEVIMRLRALLRRGEEERKMLSLPAVIDEVLSLMRSDLITRGISVSRATQPDIPPIRGGLIPLQQVFLNLFTNACDAMTTNPPRDRRLTVETKLEGACVRVAISDAGCGLPSESGRIFEPFFTTKTHGLGLGLPICRTIINAHGGRMWAVSNPDRGTTFHLELPVAEATP